MSSRPRSPLPVTALAVVTFGWLALVGMSALNRWPQASLDLPMSDPAVRAAFEAAVAAHLRDHLLAAVAPLILIGLAGVLARWRRT